jgi:hypothetical protein
MENDEEVPIFSLQASVGEAPKVTPQDEADYSTIARIKEIVVGSIADCSDIRIIDLNHPKLSAEQQVLAYQFVLENTLLPLQATIETTIDNINSQYKQ